MFVRDVLGTTTTAISVWAEAPTCLSMTRLVYIGGYGRSGSTLLEYLLTANPAIAACGEVASVLKKRPRKKKKCTCGRLIGQCPVWGFLDLSSSHAAWGHAKLTLALVENSAHRYAAMVDFSKTSWGSLTAPFSLQRRLGQRFQLLHVVRNPSAVCWSAVKRANASAPSGIIGYDAAGVLWAGGAQIWLAKCSAGFIPNDTFAFAMKT